MTSAAAAPRAGWRRAVHQAAAREGVPLGPDFPSVRLHIDEASAEAARLLSARAFTIGCHVFFGRGEYRPDDPDGRALLRHELAHVAQSPGTDLRHAASLPVSDPDDAAEREAASGGPVSRRPPGIRRVLAAYNSARTEILPPFGEATTGSLTSVTGTGDAARLSAALAGLITAGRVVTQARGDLTYFAPPATGAATVPEVTTALQTAGFPRAATMAALLLQPHCAWAFTGEKVYQVSSLWTFDVGREKDTFRPVDRPLTAAEQAEAAIVFGPGLDYSAIVIREHPVLGGLNIARTLPGSINFPPGSSARDGFLPWLIHELTHSWQYQHGVGPARMAATAVLCRTPLMSYDYGGEAGLAAARSLRSFNTEQQGDIARDYYRAVRSGRPAAVYEPFVAELQTP